MLESVCGGQPFPVAAAEGGVRVVAGLGVPLHALSRLAVWGAGVGILQGSPRRVRISVRMVWSLMAGGAAF